MRLRRTAVSADERASLSYLGPVARFLGPSVSILERQLPFTALMTIALLGLALPGLGATSAVGVAVAAALTAVMLLAAVLVPWSRLPRLAPEVLTLLQFVIVTALRQGTGGLSSPYSGMVLLPAVALSARTGLPGVLGGAAAAATSVLLGIWVGPTAGTTQPVVLRSLFVAAVALMIGLFVHEVTTRLRARHEALSQLQAAQADVLHRTQQAAAELERAVAVRRAAYDQLVSVIDSATEQAIIATDADGRVEVFNAGAERLLGYAQGEVVGRLHLTDFHLRDELLARASAGRDPDAGDLEAPDQRALVDALVTPPRPGPADARDWTYERRDGTHVTVHPAVTRRTEPDGTVAGYVVVATDVTAERESARLKDEFVGLVSHELRTPLTSVLGYVELLLDGTEEVTPDQREYLGIIERNARRQLRLVADLLLTAQVDSGTFTVSPVDVDVADVVGASLAAARPAAAAAGVTLEEDVTATPAAADPVRLGQAVDNLLSNALKFTPAGGRVRVEVAPAPDGGACLRVADSGIGIPPDELTRLAQRFYRASSATRRAIPGVGLGLSITKAVVEAHGGDVAVTSTVGEGTTFTLTLPGRTGR